jgi:hypothetical protein
VALTRPFVLVNDVNEQRSAPGVLQPQSPPLGL